LIKGNAIDLFGGVFISYQKVFFDTCGQ